MSTEIMSEFVIENLQCSFLQCKGKGQLIPSNNNFMYYYQKQTPPVFNTEGQIINQPANTNQIEIKFICQTCINEMMRDGSPYHQQIRENTQLDENKYTIFFERDERESSNPPKKGKFTQQQQKCKKCLTNEVKMQEFDTSLQTYLSNQKDIEVEIEIAKYYAKEQYKKDKYMFQQLKEKLCNNLGKIERLMILNKMKMIMEKYQ